MELKRAGDRIWYSMYEEERDRPCLGYIRGDSWSIAVDAGHSNAHVKEFYEALTQAGLPLPALTLITHWHWDHAFGMHCIHGLSVANADTNRHLREFSGEIQARGTDRFFNLDPSIQKEYAGGRPVVVVPSDIEFTGQLELYPGGITVRLSRTVSPHTDDTTLVFVPEERFLFVGDCVSGVFPTWERDPVQTGQLMRTLEQIDAEDMLGGHWPLMKKAELLRALAEESI